MADTPLDFDTVVEMIEEFPKQVKWAIEHAPEDRMVDMLGTINSVATAINVAKRRAASEIQDGDHGKTWVAEQGRKGMRSYNTSSLLRIIADTFEQSENMLATLMYLLGAEVITIKWSWTNLSNLIRKENLDLRVARHEITDGDPEYDIGEFWTDGPVRYVPREEGKA